MLDCLVMARYFNTAGPCRPDLHYMLPPERRLPEVRTLIEQQLYFVVHAPRQVGKTTSLRALAERLTAEGRYAALLTTCEIGQKAESDLDGSIAGILDNLRQRAEQALPPDLRPPAVTDVPPESRLRDLLRRWAEVSPRPVVVFFDEIDALAADVLLSVLRQLRSGYDDRPRGFPQSVALIGMRDVRDYRLDFHGHGTLGSASPFNIKAESLTLRDFTADEVAELYAQHTAATGQVFTAAAQAHAFELTRGQPWLVNALARQAVEKLVPDRQRPIDADTLDAAKELLIQRRDTHLDSLVARLLEPRVQKVIAPILAGEILAGDVLQDDVALVRDLGLVNPTPAGLEIANPIYREIIPRVLTEVLEYSLCLPRPYVDADGRLDFAGLLSDFQTFWREHAESFLARAPYSEAAAQLVFMAFVHKVVNGGGFIDREYAVGRRRIDLCVRWPGPQGIERWAIELKVWRDGQRDPLDQGLNQLTAYLERLGLASGTLVLFDGRRTAPPLTERLSQSELTHQGRQITLLRL